MRPAKCSTASVPCARIASPTRARSPTSASTNVARSGTASRWPVERSSTTRTSCPACDSTRAMCDPMYPAPPLTSVRNGRLARIRDAHGARASYRPTGERRLLARAVLAAHLRALLRGAEGAIASAGLAARAADRCHVLTVSAHYLAALVAGASGLFRTEFVRSALRVGSLSALARDLALLVHVHRSEAAVALGRVGVSVAAGRHVIFSFSDPRGRQFAARARALVQRACPRGRARRST